MPAAEPASHRACRFHARHSAQRHGIARWLQRHRPDIDDNPNLAQTTLEHAPDASFYFFTVGRLKTIDDIKHMVLALPRSATCVVLQAATGQPRAIKRYSDFTLATVGDLNDLPMIMGVLA